MSFWLCGRLFLSTLSLRRATQVFQRIAKPFRISIHALLAESDPSSGTLRNTHKNFYPRSPCGERPSPMRNYIQCCVFLSTLSLRRATASRAATISGARYFYPRSPCGERRNRVDPCGNPTHISIHALLAESDRIEFVKRKVNHHFYPRSPCGERQIMKIAVRPFFSISIHALLAESD